jgi:hypothetical protein
MIYTVKQSQFAGGLSDSRHWVPVWSGEAKDEKEAKRKAMKELARTLVAAT